MMKHPNKAWWMNPSLLVTRRVQQAHFDQIVTLPDEYGLTVMIEVQAAGLRANFGTRHVLQMTTNIELSEATKVCKALVVSFALRIPSLPKGVYYAKLKGGVWAISKGRGKRAQAVVL